MPTQAHPRLRAANPLSLPTHHHSSSPAHLPWTRSSPSRLPFPSTSPPSRRSSSALTVAARQNTLAASSHKTTTIMTRHDHAHLVRHIPHLCLVLRSRQIFLTHDWNPQTWPLYHPLCIIPHPTPSSCGASASTLRRTSSAHDHHPSRHRHVFVHGALHIFIGCAHPFPTSKPISY